MNFFSTIYVYIYIHNLAILLQHIQIYLIPNTPQFCNLAIKVGIIIEFDL